MVALVFASLIASMPSPPADAWRSDAFLEAADSSVNLSGRRLASTTDWSVDQAPTSRAVAAVSSFAATGTGVAMFAGFAYLLKTSAFAPPTASWIVGFSLGFLLLNFGPNVADLLNGDVLRFAAHGGLRLLLLAVGAVFPYALLGWLASVVVDLREARDAPARWAQRKRVADSNPARPEETPGFGVITLAF